MTAVHTLPLPFGRHKGKTLAELMRTDPTYIAWLADEADRPVWRKLAAAALGLADEADHDDDHSDQDKTPAAMVLPRVAFDVLQTLTERHGTDPETLALAYECVNEVGRICARYTRRKWIELPPVYLPTETDRDSS